MGTSPKVLLGAPKKVMGENTPEPEVHYIGFFGSTNQSKLLQKRMFLRNMKKIYQTLIGPVRKTNNQSKREIRYLYI